jgi:hypothetical protein
MHGAVCMGACDRADCLESKLDTSGLIVDQWSLKERAKAGQSELRLQLRLDYYSQDWTHGIKADSKGPRPDHLALRLDHCGSAGLAVGQDSGGWVSGGQGLPIQEGSVTLCPTDLWWGWRSPAES